MESKGLDHSDGSNGNGSDGAPSSGTRMSYPPRTRWYLATLFVLACDFCLFLSMFYITLAAGEYNDNKSRYLGISWGIFFALMVVISLVVLFSWQQKRAFFDRQISPKWKRVLDRRNSPRYKMMIDLGNGALCFILVVVYLFVFGVPAYNEAKWEVSLDFGSQELPLPAFAFIITRADNMSTTFPFDYKNGTNGPAISANFTNTNSIVPFPPEAYSTRYLSGPSTRERTVLIANASVLQQNTTNPLGSSLQVALQGTWNGSLVGPMSAAPTLQFIVFDARVDIEGLLYCGPEPAVRMELFTSSSYQVSIKQIKDDRGKITTPRRYSSACPSFYRSILTELNPPLYTYGTSLGARQDLTTSNALTECDVSTNPDAECRSRVVLQYGSQIVEQQQSVPGKSRFQMWIDVGSIVGSIQAVAWFAMQLFGG